ncbi:unnamed protein product [Amaranthus hypochondriacus]
MFRERSCEGFAAGFEFQKRSRKDHVRYSSNFNGYPSQRPARGSWAGNRGFTLHRWWRGPREPTFPSAVTKHGGVVSLFLDGIPRKASRFNLLRIFSKVGVVADIYISTKLRKNRPDYFGFVRFYHIQAARRAVMSFDGMFVCGSKISVSMARYFKDGTPITVVHSAVKKSQDLQRHICLPSRYGSRRFADVVLGKRPILKSVEEAVVLDKEEAIMLKNATNEIRASKQENSIPTPSTVHVTEKNEEKSDLMHFVGDAPRDDSCDSDVSLAHTPNPQKNQDSLGPEPLKLDSTNCEKVSLPMGNGSFDILSEKDISLIPAVPTPIDECVSVSTQSQRSSVSLVPLTKRSRKMLLNSKEIANYLGFYGPTKV